RGAGKRAFAARAGRLSARVRALRVLRGVRARGWMGDAAERDPVAQRSHSPAAPRSPETRRVHRACSLKGVAPFQLICKIEDNRSVVLVLRMGHRKEIYR